MGSWTAAAVLDALRARLELRAGLAGVMVFTAAMGDQTPPEAIVFFGANGSQAWASVNKTTKPKDDRFTIGGGIWIVKPGAGEAIAKSARDRAIALLKEIEDELRADPTVGGVTNVITVHVSGDDLDQGTNANGRWCQIDFDLAVWARI